MNASSLTSATGTIFKFGPFIVGLLFGLIGDGLVYILKMIKIQEEVLGMVLVLG